MKNHENTSIEEINSIDCNEPDINNEQNKVSNGKMMLNIIAMYFINLESALQYIEIENPYTHKICKLLVDSGAQLNIIKKCQIPAHVSLEGKKSNYRE